jgi:quaternary ammonium compound-resistance protein SugE
LLIIAGAFESAWAVFLKQAEGFSRWKPTVGFLLTAGVSLFLLARALRDLPVGPAYAIWTGIGATGTALVGILLLGESASLGKLVSIALIVAGMVGLRLSTA